MGIWVDAPSLRQGEDVVMSVLATKGQSRFRSVGGRLVLTTDRLLFMPNRLDRSTGGRRWESPLTDILSVSIAPSDLGRAASQGLGVARRSLRIVPRAGDEQFVRTLSLDDVCLRIRRAVENTHRA